MKKTIAFLSALALTAASAVSVPISAEEAAADIFEAQIGETFEAEELITGDKGVPNGNGPVWNAIYQTELPGYSGDGFIYVTATPYEFAVNAPADGMYDLSIRYVQILNEGESRQGSFEVNGIKYTTQFAYTKEWTDKNVGKIRLNKGRNTIKLTGDYGYAAYDTITVKEAEFPSLEIADSTPCDPDATPEAKGLMKYLKSVYGKNILSGQQTIYGGGHGVQTTIHYNKETDKCVDSDGNEYSFTAEDKGEYNNETVVWHCTGKDGQVYSYNTQNRNYTYNEYDRELKYLQATVGDMSAIQGFDFGANCPCYQWDDGAVERMIDWTNNKNGICTASWHINVPTTLSEYTLGEPLDFSKTTYSEKCDFKPSNAYTEGTAEYDYWQLCKKNLAEQLLKLQAAGEPLTFRPLHEAEGNVGQIPGDGNGSWFWWGKEGAEVYKTLWKDLYTTLTEEYGIHNLIWEQNLYSWDTDNSALWYSGDDYVDIVGFDKYNTQYNRHDGKQSGVPNLDAESGIFWTLYDEVKGKKMVSMPENDSIPSLDNLKVENAAWLYFCPWYDEESSPKFLSGSEYQDVDELKKLYQSDYCVTLSELPDWKNFSGGSDIEPDIDFIPGDVNGDKKVNVFDSIAIKRDFIDIAHFDKDYVPAPHAFAADVTGDGFESLDDVVLLGKFLTGQKVRLTWYKGEFVG